MADVDHEETFEGADAGASQTYPMQCSSLRKNGYVVLKERPCKIVEMSTSKTGKYGHAKVHMIGIDLFNNKKYKDICPSTHNMSVPNVVRQDYQFMSLDGDGFLCLMGDRKEIRERSERDESFNVTVLKVMGEEVPIGCKSGQD
ncbi:unnamed protein product [Candidula unifasciata]|uniref:Eukaryotic translation initiation factor 5A n=1 Tax=Candidula unifasciata TaxID=100452 RepID=A0A8S3ZJU6_9EUPU|nr:unnamed protein product [Candidula unifasciata]